MRTHRGAAAISFVLALGAAAPGALARSHVVGPGDSLWRIARANRCDVDAVRRANRLRLVETQREQDVQAGVAV